MSVYCCFSSWFTHSIPFSVTGRDREKFQQFNKSIFSAYSPCSFLWISPSFSLYYIYILFIGMMQRPFHSKTGGLSITDRRYVTHKQGHTQGLGEGEAIRYGHVSSVYKQVPLFPSLSFYRSVFLWPRWLRLIASVSRAAPVFISHSLRCRRR